ncbi:MAG: 4-hydroxy-3-methylbut-2-enyl diphosphate reductase [Thermoguttaceae bacterium]|nr:4-hydroxy-3-methylbut-2-enyl diphosphate reductase [Thermoguttaceae bacterium]
MKILLVSPRGFCAGVNRAISALHEALKRWGTPFYVFHEIVHNTWVVEEFRRLGVVFVDSVEDVPAGAHLMFSAHGVSPRIRKRCEEKGIQVVDATCPLVTRIHKQAVQLAEAGFQILLIGHAGHDEIVGIVEEAPEATIVLGSAEEAERVSLLDEKPAAYLTQTTLAGDKAQKIIDVLTRRFPDILPPKTNCICFATQNRQKAVSETAGEADLVLIVGSRNSSNSQRLRELAERKNVPAYLVDGPDDLQKEWFSPEQTVLVSAGASAPESVVEDVVSWIRTHFNADVELREICRETLQFQLPEI